MAGERRLQDAQVTHDPVAFPGSHQSYPWMTLPSWTIPRPVSLNASSHGDDEGPLIQAIRSGDADKVRDIMMSVTNPRSLMGPNKDGWTPLHEAAYYGQIDCLTILLAAAPWMINSKTLKNQTPLILAVSRGHLACMKYLLKNGADPGIPTTSNDTPLYEACATFNVQMVQLLVQYGADVNQKCLDGWTVLHEAVTQNNQEICEILLDYGAMVCSPNLYGVTPLFLAAQCGCVKVLKFLLKNGADINSEAKDGATALYEACRNGHTEIVELLLSQSADANRPGKDGLLPLHVAAKGGSDGIVSMLIPTTSKTKIQQSGISPLHLAAENDEDDVLELLIQADFEINAVLAPKHSHMYEDRRITALYFAVDNSNIEAATMLLEAGADPNLDPFNPLLLAVRKDHVEMATLLMEHGANVNASIPTHPTTFPACVMLSVRNLTMLKCVMDHGGDAIACFQCEYNFSVDQILFDLLNEQLEIYDSWAHIKEKSTLPKCLMQLCRLRIRQLMGTERLKYISTLPLPRRLIEYLNFKQQK
uniref:SOCS box domain-containing protein n=1 Tax=Pygocentrus nattereri TaxID=42514 RepID=A0AAR2IVH6_PYGNA